MKNTVNFFALGACLLFTAPLIRAVDYDTQIQSIWTGNCATVGCHSGAFPTAGMNLSAGVSYANLVNVVSSGYSPALRVKPGDTLNSVLWHKVNGTGVYGFLMPFGGLKLSQPNLDLISAWIAELSCCTGTTGNVNMLGIVDLSDLSALISYLTGGGYLLPCASEANVNNAGIVDLSDLSALISYLTGAGYVLPNCS